MKQRKSGGKSGPVACASPARAAVVKNALASLFVTMKASSSDFKRVLTGT